MSSVAICALLTRVGYSPVFQISCRDYNRIAIQGNVLGAAALGVCNILCLSGDGVQCGDHPEAKPVFDLDSTALLQTIKVMRDEKRFLSGRKITTPPPMFMGAAANPFVPPYDFRADQPGQEDRGRRAVHPDAILLRRAAARALHGRRSRDMGLDQKCFILVGVGPLASARTAKWMRSNVPGVHIPDEVITRLEGAQNQKAEGKRLCIDIIQQVREIKGVAGVHVMAYRQEEYVSEIVHEFGRARRPHAVAPRPRPEPGAA